VQVKPVSNENIIIIFIIDKLDIGFITSIYIGRGCKLNFFFLLYNYF
jgi:hypothetical protein